MNEFKREFTKKYLKEITDCIKKMETFLPEKIEKIAKILLNAREDGKKIFFMGNGGSGATASHFASDLSKGTINPKFKRFKAIALTDNMPTVLAWANDVGYEAIFVEQLKNLLEKDDIVIGISGSGNSENIIKAIEYANANNAITIGLTGFDGGKLKNIVHECIIVPSNYMQQIEDMHLLIEHLLTSAIREEMVKFG